MCLFSMHESLISGIEPKVALSKMYTCRLPTFSRKRMNTILVLWLESLKPLPPAQSADAVVMVSHFHAACNRPHQLLLQLLLSQIIEVYWMMVFNGYMHQTSATHVGFHFNFHVWLSRMLKLTYIGRFGSGCKRQNSRSSNSTPNCRLFKWLWLDLEFKPTLISH